MAHKQICFSGELPGIAVSAGVLFISVGRPGIKVSAVDPSVASAFRNAKNSSG